MKASTQFHVYSLQDRARNAHENFTVRFAPLSLTLWRPGLWGAPGLVFVWIPEESVKITKKITATAFLRVNTARSESKSGAAPPWGVRTSTALHRHSRKSGIGGQS